MIYLVNTEYVKDNTLLEDAVGDDLIKPIIKLTQQTYLRDFLSRDVYNFLLTELDNNTLLPEEEALVEEIQYLLALMVYRESILKTSASIGSQGLAQRSSSVESPMSESEAKALMSSYDADIDSIKDYVRELMCEVDRVNDILVANLGEPSDYEDSDLGPICYDY